MSNGPIANALAALSALSVPGVTNIGVGALPENISRAALPALLVLPTEGTDDRLFGDRGTAFPDVTFSGGARSFSLVVTHLLLTAPAYGKVAAHLPELVDHIDDYIAALSADVTLGGSLAAPAEVRIEIGAYTAGETRYHGCAFRHTWTLEVST